MKQPERYERSRALHERSGGFIMPNAWDGLSALLLKQAGFEAIGTSSAAIASTFGRRSTRVLPASVSKTRQAIRRIRSARSTTPSRAFVKQRRPRRERFC